MESTPVVAVLAIIASLVSGSGLIVKIVEWRKSVREKELDREKLELDVKGKREERRSRELDSTGRIVDQLFSRIDKLEEKVDESKAAAAECEDRYVELSRKMESTSRSTQSDHAELKRHIRQIETESAAVKAKLRKQDWWEDTGRYSIAPDTFDKVDLRSEPTRREKSPMTKTQSIDRGSLSKLVEVVRDKGPKKDK
jgi:hypothetical protein